MFSFIHPDPDKVWRLLKRWSSGYEWSTKDLQEFCSLAIEWAKYYMIMGNMDEAKKILNKRASILKKVNNGKCIIKKTASGDVRYALKKSVYRLETCL